ncbi:expressed unknown protein [Seminavis robusta]|uniref:Uncharacterized protein n=1 Tax=Seminavis robusta TaxID=568900 RepID=A0A9N8EQ29_9STRA|nr:expressed unknown protein [Seminavis robusta]|eukprot:Sro1487_g276830.1 n/a (280) ;mRNA; r:26115-26954
MSSTLDGRKKGKVDSQLHPIEVSGLGDTLNTTTSKEEKGKLSAESCKTPKTKSGSKAESPDSTSSQETQSTTATTAAGVSNTGLAVAVDIAAERAYNQDGFPEEIKNKEYTSEAELVKDLEEFGLLDDYKRIALTLVSSGKAYRLDLPTDFHETSIEWLQAKVLRECGSGVLCSTKSQILFSDGSSRFPDLAIFGEARVRVVEDLAIKKPKQEWCEELECKTYLNPHVLIEFSWRHDLKEEIPKFIKQMEQYPEQLGSINVGFLIKTVPASGEKVSHVC